MSENYKFVQNSKCEFFPCHKVPNSEKFNCLFCYCPLYLLKEQCGGNYKYTKSIKDCSHCSIPHSPGGYDFIRAKMDLVIELAKK
ncbi:MAG: metal-binding protein [Peptococcaceae bacterium BICA1-8]|nr:MAG: metal-binding protein [Peptococcaceae bacterium BICA1-8]